MKAEVTPCSPSSIDLDGKFGEGGVDPAGPFNWLTTVDRALYGALARDQGERLKRGMFEVKS